MARKSSTERAQQLVGGFATAKKKVVIRLIFPELTEERRKQLAKDIEKKGVSDADITEVDVYIKPEERSVYYVVNEEVNGSVFF